MTEKTMPETDIAMLAARVEALTIAVAFLAVEAGHATEQGTDFIVGGLMTQHAAAAGHHARLCFAIEDLVAMIDQLRED